MVEEQRRRRHAEGPLLELSYEPFWEEVGLMRRAPYGNEADNAAYRKSHYILLGRYRLPVSAISWELLSEVYDGEDDDLTGRDAPEGIEGFRTDDPLERGFWRSQQEATRDEDYGPYPISRLIRRGYTQPEIAGMFKVSQSTISRRFKRECQELGAA